MTGSDHDFSESATAKISTLAQWILKAGKVVWFTGAGISTESGLPDFRGPDGFWTRRDKGLDPPRPKKPWEDVRPNAAHFAITEFQRIGKCEFLISQNVDNLHLKSGYPFEKLAELHGNLARVRCRPCGKTYRSTFHRMYQGASCPGCGEPLEGSVINFGDALPEKDLEASFEWAANADLMIVVGSSCRVAPASDIPMVTKHHGGKLVIMNMGETGLDDVCDLRFNDERVGELLPELLEIVRVGMNDLS